MKKIPVIFFILIVMIGVTGCGEKISVDSYVATALAGTAAIETLIAEKAAATVAAIPTATLTPIPTQTPTITPLPPVTAQLTTNAYCRPGPDAIYGQGKMLHSRDSVLVVGRVDDEAAWLLVQPPEGIDACWITSKALSIVGETAWVEIVLVPPTPTATSPAILFTLSFIKYSLDYGQHTLRVSLVNKSSINFKQYKTTLYDLTTGQTYIQSAPRFFMSPPSPDPILIKPQQTFTFEYRTTFNPLGHNLKFVVQVREDDTTEQWSTNFISFTP